jgi:exodeoxyribonuclease VII small subunit
MNDTRKGLEESMTRLEKIVSELESGEHTLEESLARFEEGLELGRQCRRILDQAEVRIRRLLEVDGDGNRREEDFDGDR